MTLQTDQPGSTAIPAVSVIVPARNEQVCLERCLTSIVEQRGVKFEVIVVDDGSTDRTTQISEAFARIRECPVIVQNPDLVKVTAAYARSPLPNGWTGKVNALWTGLQHARGEWLLFTDADTVHKRGSLARVVEEARSNSAALVSYSPQQEVQGLLERSVMPIVFAELAATYRPREVSDPNLPTAAANGQYLLISWEALQAIGGLEKVAPSLLEDVALARLVKNSGRPIRFRYGAEAVSARMYRTWEAMREGWSKNLALLFPNARRLAAMRTAEFALMTMTPILAFVAWIAGATMLASLAAAVAVPT